MDSGIGNSYFRRVHTAGVARVTAVLAQGTAVATRGTAVLARVTAVTHHGVAWSVRGWWPRVCKTFVASKP